MSRTHAGFGRGLIALLAVAGALTIPFTARAGNTVSPMHKKLKELRLAMAGLTLTDDEKALIKAMKTELTPDFNKVPFQDVIKLLEEKTGVTIVIDPNALKALKIDATTPVTFASKNKVTLRATLKKILGDLGLAYILKDGIIQVVTPQVAENALATRTYYVGDRIPPGPGMWPFGKTVHEQFFGNRIAQRIVLTVDPQSWAVNGKGKGTIQYKAVSKCLVISNSMEVHLNIKASMAGK
jgi:hypothetical protein